MKLTKEEKNWILYDVGNSAFTLLIATIMPLYFNYLAEQAGLSSVDYLAYWGYAGIRGNAFCRVYRAGIRDACGYEGL